MTRMMILLALILSVSCEKQVKPIVIAHRGAPGYLPEHSLPGTAMAHHFDVDYIEPDVVMTKDDELILMHDPHIDTTTNVADIFPNRKRADGRFYAIDFTLDEIKKLTLHERIDPISKSQVFSERFAKSTHLDLKVPSFEDFISLVQGLNQTRKKDIGIYVEFKAYAFHKENGKDIIAKLMETLNRRGLNTSQSKVYIQSFDPNALKQLRSNYKLYVPLIQLIGENSWGETDANYEEMRTEKGLAQVATYAQGIGPWLNHILVDQGKKEKPKQTKLLEYAKELGLKVHVYTFRKDQLPAYVNTFEQLHDLYINYLKVDGIFSDFADITKQYVDKK